MDLGALDACCVNLGSSMIAMIDNYISVVGIVSDRLQADRCVHTLLLRLAGVQMDQADRQDPNSVKSQPLESNMLTITLDPHIFCHRI